MQIPWSEAPNPQPSPCEATVQTIEPPCCPTQERDNKRKEKKNNEKLMGDLWSTLQAISSPLSWLAAPTRAGGVPQGDPLCGYHTPSSGCSGVKCQQQLAQSRWLLLWSHNNMDKTDWQTGKQTNICWRNHLPWLKHNRDSNEKKTMI